MGGAIIRGYLDSVAMKAMDPDEIFVYDSDQEKADAFAAAGLPVRKTDSLAQLADFCDVLILCVKPNIMDYVLDELAGLCVCDGKKADVEKHANASFDTDEGVKSVADAKAALPELHGKLIISIAAGISIGHILEKLGAGVRVVRVMPNTPAMVGEGMSAMSASDGLSGADAAMAEKLFSAVGKAIWVSEIYMDAVTGISGSSPAYAYLFIEGLVNAGIEDGLPKEAATLLAAQSTLGAAKMVLENLGEVEPRQLCVNVCSPGGTTIEAVKVLEEAGFTDTVCKAAQASAAKSKLMTR
jgi:pyrroline-5-carboxylate reductase